MPFRFNMPARLLPGQGCPCGCALSYARPKASGDRTVSWRKRAGSRRNKRSK